MDYKGFLYTYALKSDSPAEVVAVGEAYQNAGWIEEKFIPDTDPPTHIVFKWTQDGRPRHPEVVYP